MEQRLYRWWEANGYFKPRENPQNPDRKPFVISMPPPNVTGALHLGHALTATLEDIMIRYHRMLRRRDALGAGRGSRGHRHADGGRAADRAEKAPTATRMGREAFVERVWEWVQPVQAPHPGSAPAAGRLVRLGARALHAGRGAGARRARGLRSPLRGGADLSRRAHHQLVPDAAELDLRPGGRGRGHARQALLRPLSAGADRGRGARRATSPSRRRGPRRSWAIPASRSIPTTSATAIWWDAIAILPIMNRRIPDRRR